MNLNSYYLAVDFLSFLLNFDCCYYLKNKLIYFFVIFSLVDRYTLDAFATSGFDFNADSLENEDALLYRFMKEFNHSAAADNPLAGLASKTFFNNYM